MMKSRFIRLLAIAGLLAIPAPLRAHHGTASFDTEKELTLNGTVTEWLWSNPHCFLKFDAKDDTGTVRTWIVETGNPTDMSRRGWTRTSFKGGDVLKVSLTPVKNGSPIGRMRSVTFANGAVLSAAGPLPAPAP
jgi:uncharacterized protein DUF6152